MHAHSHDHEHHHHTPSSGSKFYIALVLTLVFAFIEAFAGWISGSLALLGDAGHMFSDSAALGFAALAIWLSKKPASNKHSYGLLRAEIVGALVNGLFMLYIVTEIALAAFERFGSTVDVDASVVIIVGSIGLLINLIVAFVLSSAEDTLNSKAALLHVMGDILGSIAAILSGIVIYYSGWMMIDPLLSLLICVLILNSTVRLLKEIVHIIMEGVPPHIALEKVGMALAAIDDVRSVHDLHIWNLSSGKIALSAHVMLDDIQKWEMILIEAQTLLKKEFSIEHITLQPELTPTAIIQPKNFSINM